MAVLSMKKIYICALKRDRKPILEKLQYMGVMQIRTDKEEDDVFKKTNTSAEKSKYEKRVANTDNALEIIQQYAPEKTSLFAGLEGKKIVDSLKLNSIIESRRKYNIIVKKVQDTNKEIAALKANISKNEVSIDGLRPWENMDIPINTTGTKATDVLIGTMGPGLTESDIETLVAGRQPDLTGFDINVVSADKDQTCIVVICLKSVTGKLEECLRAEGFTRMSFISSRTPADKIVKYREEIKDFEAQIEAKKAEIAEQAQYRDDLRLLSDYYRIRAEKYEVIGGLLQSESTFVLSGYILARDEEKIKKELNDSFSIMVECSDVPEDEAAPVKLENKKLFASAEGVLNSYGLPGKGEMDPTSVMSLCYIFLFGLMLSDAAYGFIIFIACFLALKKFKNMDENLAKSVRLFQYCGISTLVWGVMFGGYFGDAINVVSRTFLGKEVALAPVWFAPLDDPMKMLMFSLLFGLIHLFMGLAMKGYMCLKKKDIVGFVFDVLAWYCLIGGLVLLLLPTSLFESISQVHFAFPEWLKTLSLVITIVGLVSIVLMSGRKNKNVALRIALGLYDVYGLTSWLSDLLSYSRLLALGLATGVIAQVINQMGSMVGKGPVGFILFVIIFIIGHTLNLAINTLGAYVHTCRLQYVEFFGKFYEGGGEPFTPFKENTKYVKIKED